MPQPNAINWNELVTSDSGAAIRFYSAMFGWTTEAFPMPGAEYTMLKMGDKPFGGVVVPPAGGPPPQWMPYVSVPDVDAAVVQATALGATVMMPGMDIGDTGRIAILRDPQGAAFGLHQAKGAC